MTPQQLGGLVALDVDDVHPSPSNPRENLTGIDDLALSIREAGLIQPIIVQKVPGRDRHQIVAGHRRLAAVKRLGWVKVPAIIRKDMLPDEELLAMVIENGQRADLDPIEEARAYRRLLAMGLTQSDIARRVGRSQMTVSSRLALLALSPAEQEEIRAGQVNMSYAVAKARIAGGTVKPGAKGKKSAQHLSSHHPLGTKVRNRCTALKHKGKGAASVGGIGCGECWEAVIRADERQLLLDKSSERSQCVLCDAAMPEDFETDVATVAS